MPLITLLMNQLTLLAGNNHSPYLMQWWKLFLFYKLFKENKPVDLFNIILTKVSNHNTRNTDKITLFHTKHNFFKNHFFPSTVIEWHKLHPNLRSAVSL